MITIMEKKKPAISRKEKTPARGAAVQSTRKTLKAKAKAVGTKDAIAQPELSKTKAAKQILISKSKAAVASISHSQQDARKAGKLSAESTIKSLESQDAIKQRLSAIQAILETQWQDTTPLIHAANPFELLIATILSAQCTDDQVNKVTPTLFAQYPDPAALAKADTLDLEQVIKSLGFFHAKTRHLIACAHKLMVDFDGQVPRTMDELTSLPGVGRKTANLVTSACFGAPGLIVDTHVLRLVQRLGFPDCKDADKAERFLANTASQSTWTVLSHGLNRHGKFICTARKPRCLTAPDECVLYAHCHCVGVALSTILSQPPATKKK